MKGKGSCAFSYTLGAMSVGRIGSAYNIKIVHLDAAEFDKDSTQLPQLKYIIFIYFPLHFHHHLLRLLADLVT